MYKPAEVAILKEGGALLSQVLGETAALVRPGITTRELDAYAEKRIRALGGTPSFLNYQNTRRDPPFPATVCISLDEEVVHGIPTERRVKDGMLVKLDIGMWYGGLATDMACTVMVGNVTSQQRELTEVTLEALRLAISKCQAGGWVSDIGKAVDKLVKRHGCSTVKDLVGHGVGHHVHEDPPVPNFFDGHLKPVKIVPGMVLALEPMINACKDDFDEKEDQWTIYAADMKPSAHFEATVAITENGTEIVTPIQTGGL